MQKWKQEAEKKKRADSARCYFSQQASDQEMQFPPETNELMHWIWWAEGNFPHMPASQSLALAYGWPEGLFTHRILASSWTAPYETSTLKTSLKNSNQHLFIFFPPAM